MAGFANQALNDFLAGSGAGFDAAGRRVYTGEHMLYGGPRDRAATQAVQGQLESAAMNEDEASFMIRKLLDELSRNRSNFSNYYNPYLSESQRPVASSGSFSYSPSSNITYGAS